MGIPFLNSKCPECGGKDFTQEPEDWDMTEGQLADEMAGTSGTAVCNNCGHAMPFDM